MRLCEECETGKTVFPRVAYYVKNCYERKYTFDE